MAAANLQSALNTVAIFSIIVSTIALALRFYVRVILLRRVQVDDYLILFSWLLLLGYLFCVLEQVKLGLGKHVEYVIEHPDNVGKLLLYYFIGNNLLYTALCIVKITIATFFLSLNPPRPLRIVAIVMIVITILTCLAAELYHIVHCYPVSYFWTRWNGIFFGRPTKGWCLDSHKAFAVNQTLNTMDVISDFTLAALPTIMIWNMRLSRAKKCGVSFLLGLGAFSAISPFIRAFYLKGFVSGSLDSTYHSAPLVILAMTEISFAITAICITQLRPLARQIFSAVWFTTEEPDSNIIPTFGQGVRRAKPSNMELAGIEITVHGVEIVHQSDKDAKAEHHDGIPPGFA